MSDKSVAEWQRTVTVCRDRPTPFAIASVASAAGPVWALAGGVGPANLTGTRTRVSTPDLIFVGTLAFVAAVTFAACATCNIAMRAVRVYTTRL